MKPMKISYRGATLLADGWPTTRQIGQRAVYASVDEVPLAILIATEEDQRPGEGAKEGRSDSAVKASPKTFLAEYPGVG